MYPRKLASHSRIQRKLYHHSHPLKPERLKLNADCINIKLTGLTCPMIVKGKLMQNTNKILRICTWAGKFPVFPTQGSWTTAMNRKRYLEQASTTKNDAAPTRRFQPNHVKPNMLQNFGPRHCKGRWAWLAHNHFTEFVATEHIGS